MRVPDLDWPADLFSDDIITIQPDAIVMKAVSPAVRPTLWAAMTDTWFGNGAFAQSQWPPQAIGSDHAAG